MIKILNLRLKIFTCWQCLYICVCIQSLSLDSSLGFIHPAFFMMYSAYKLNKQGDNIQPWFTPFLIWNQSGNLEPVGNLISGFSDFSKSSLNIWKFMVYVLLQPHLENFEHNFASVWDEYNCAVVWTFFGTAFLWDWNENWPFPVLWPLLSCLDLLAYWVQHFHSIIS